MKFKISMHFLCVILCFLSSFFVITTHAYNIDGPATVSGISSGAFFAVQYHVAMSSEVNGIAVLSGGPYYCAQNNLKIAFNACMSSPELIDVDLLIAATNDARASFSIDPEGDFNKTTSVFLVHGTTDSVVQEGVIDMVGQYYSHWLPSERIHWNISETFGHGWPTLDYGVACNTTGLPFLLACGIDMGERIFSTILDRKALKPRGISVNESYVEIDQQSFLSEPYSLANASMSDKCYAYVPAACSNSNGQSCALHIAFHGCEMGVPNIGLAFVRNSGLNEWAESNNIVVLYPQLEKNDAFNPMGCWDFWGYTGDDYSLKIAAQINTVKNMVDHISMHSAAASVSSVFNTFSSISRIMLLIGGVLLVFL